MSIGVIALAGGVIAGAFAVNNVMTLYPPLGRFYNYKANQATPNEIPPIQDLIAFRYRGLMGEEEYTETAKRLGLERFYSFKLFQTSETLLNAYEYITLWRRGKLTEDDLNTKLDHLHFSSTAKDHFKTVTEYFPSPQDLILFAVREVYSPEILQKFGQMQDLPEKFITEAAKAGIQPDQAANYWAAHWQLPSPLQGFEMLHRDVIDEDTLKMLLKALDIMPYWRDALVQISYNPLTRVDVRRMHKLGVLDDKGVKRAYKDIGYNEENADKMLQFTRQYNADEISGISRSNVQKAYKLDLITESELRNYFVLLGFKAEVIDFWVSMTVYEKELDELEDVTGEMVDLYKLGYLDYDDLRIELAHLDVPSYYITGILAKVKKQKSKKAKMPSRGDVEKWLDKEIIEEKEYVSYMRRIGYRDAEITNYLTEISLTKDTSKRKYLPIKTYQRWLQSNIINEKTFREIGWELNISPVDIDRMILEGKED